MQSHCEGLSAPFKPDWRAFVDNLGRKGTPRRVHHIELFQDKEISDALVERFDLTVSLDPADSHFERKRYIALQRFCGFDYVRAGLLDQPFPVFRASVKDSADLARAGGRQYQDESKGPIMSWEDYERYEWPNPELPSATRGLEWYQRNLPDDMCLVGSGGFGHFCEMLTWLMGYETFCFALYDQRDLVEAIAARLLDYYRRCLKRILEFDRVKVVWGSDDMGHRTGLLFSADAMRALVLSGHREMARMAHEAGRPYLLHSCGKLDEIMTDLIEDVRIDGLHSYEDTIIDVRDAKLRFGKQIAILGGVDIDFLCRAQPDAIRKRVRDTLDVCQPGGGYCLGTGNSVANYIPLDNYLAMVDEGRLYGGARG